MFRYRKAFLRNDGPRYRAYLAQVAAGKAALHTSTLYPYELVAPLLDGVPSEGERRALDAAWKALPDYTGGEDALVVVDGSGSMYWSAAQPGPLRWPCLWASISPSATKGRSGGTSSPFPAGPG